MADRQTDRQAATAPGGESGGHVSWRTGGGVQDRRRFRARLVRWLVLLSTGGLIALFALVLWRPFHHPEPYLFLLTGADRNPVAAGHVLSEPPPDFAAEDAAAFDKLTPVLHRDGQRSGPIPLDGVRRAGAAAIGEALAGQVEDEPAVLILYVRALGVTDADRGLLTWTLDREAGPAGRIGLSELLGQLAARPAPVKLLIVDAGRMDHDPRLGLVVNEFPRVLRREVERIGDPRLWVLGSHQILERSHLLRGAGRSVFGRSVADGLQGAADLNGNRVVDLAELYRYVRAHVETTVREVTDGGATQTPMLVWGGGAQWTDEWPVLVPVAQTTPDGSPADEPKSSKQADTTAAASRSWAEAAKSRSLSTGATPTRLTRPAIPRPAMPTRPTARIAGLPPLSTPRPSLPTAKLPGISTAGTTSAASPAEPTAPAAGPASPAAATEPAPVTAAATSPTGGSGADAAGGIEAGPTMMPETVPELVAEAWALRDELNQPAGVFPRPLDYAPHLWRAVEEEILAYERLARAGRGVDEDALADRLTAMVRGLRALAAGERSLFPGTPDAVRRIAQLTPENPLADVPLLSLGLVELSARLDGAPLADAAPQPLSVIIAAYDALTAAGEHAAFRQWIDMVPPELDRFVEIRLARRLAVATGPGEWLLTREALRVCRQAERAAATSLSAPAWCRETIAAADRARREAERDLADRAVAGWRPRVERGLRRAADLYAQAAAEVESVEAATRLRNDLLRRLPWYVRWWHAAGETDTATATGPGADDLRQLIAWLGRLSVLLETPADTEDSLPEVRRLQLRLERLRGQIEAPLSPESLHQVTTAPVEMGDAWRLEILLSTPLLERDERLGLLAEAPDLEAQALANLPPVHYPRSVTVPDDRLGPRQWRHLVRRAELDAGLADLARLLPPDDAEIDAEIVAALDRVQVDVADGVQTLAEAERCWDEFDALGAALEHFHATLPSRLGSAYRHNQNLTDPAARSDCLMKLRVVERTLRLLDARDALRTGPLDVVGLLRQVEAADLLSWHRERALAAREDAYLDEAEILTEAAQTYRDGLSGLPSVAQRLVSAVPLRIEGPPQLALTETAMREIAVRIEHDEPEAVPVWLVLKYDDARLAVAASDESPLYTEAELIRRGRSYPYRPDRNDPPTVLVPPGPGTTVRLRVARRSEAAGPVPLIVRAVSPANYVRHRVDVTLPYPASFGVSLAGLPGSWDETPDGLRLQPLPNRPTGYRLSLSNQTGEACRVDVALSALSRPLVDPPPVNALSPADAKLWSDHLGMLLPLASATELPLPADSRPVPIPFTAPVATPAAPAISMPPMPPLAANDGQANGQGAGPGGGPGDDAAAAASDGPPRVPVPHGLLLSVTDRATSRTTLRVVRLAPQRPRRYVQAEAGYDLARQRVKVRVRLRDPGLFPPGGVPVRCELADGLDPQWQAQLGGHIAAPDGEARLSIAVPSRPGRVVTVGVHVDEYPRAFVFEVPCDADSDGLPEQSNRHAVRVIAPEEGAAFPAPTAAVPVRLQVDAPVGSFSGGPDFVEVGIDVNLDRILRGEAPLRFDNDRQVRLLWGGVGPGGEVAVIAEVSDFEVAVPASGLRNARVNVLGRLVTTGRTSWSDPVRIIVDGAGPVLSKPRLSPGRVVAQGEDLVASVLVDDHARSGVARVEAAIDAARTGTFGPETKPVPAVAGPGGRWSAALGTGELKPGEYTVLFRAVDRVGNVSGYETAVVEIISAEEAARRLAAATNALGGVVRDGNGPVRGAEVTLTFVPPEDAPKPVKPPPRIAPVTTNRRGEFTFPAVPPGQYQLTAEGVVRGYTRTRQLDVTVVPPPTRLNPVTIQIDEAP